MEPSNELLENIPNEASKRVKLIDGSPVSRNVTVGVPASEVGDLFIMETKAQSNDSLIVRTQNKGNDTALTETTATTITPIVLDHDEQVCTTDTVDNLAFSDTAHKPETPQKPSTKADNVCSITPQKRDIGQISGDPIAREDSHQAISICDHDLATDQSIVENGTPTVLSEDVAISISNATIVLIGTVQGAKTQEVMENGPIGTPTVTVPYDTTRDTSRSAHPLSFSTSFEAIDIGQTDYKVSITTRESRPLASGCLLLSDFAPDVATASAVDNSEGRTNKIPKLEMVSIAVSKPNATSQETDMTEVSVASGEKVIVTSQAIETPSVTPSSGAALTDDSKVSPANDEVASFSDKDMATSDDRIIYIDIDRLLTFPRRENSASLSLNDLMDSVSSDTEDIEADAALLDDNATDDEVECIVEDEDTVVHHDITPKDVLDSMEAELEFFGGFEFYFEETTKEHSSHDATVNSKILVSHSQRENAPAIDPMIETATSGTIKVDTEFTIVLDTSVSSTEYSHKNPTFAAQVDNVEDSENTNTTDENDECVVVVDFENLFNSMFEVFLDGCEVEPVNIQNMNDVEFDDLVSSWVATGESDGSSSVYDNDVDVQSPQSVDSIEIASEQDVAVTEAAHILSSMAVSTIPQSLEDSAVLTVNTQGENGIENQTHAGFSADIISSVDSNTDLTTVAIENLLSFSVVSNYMTNREWAVAMTGNCTEKESSQIFYTVKQSPSSDVLYLDGDLETGNNFSASEFTDKPEIFEALEFNNFIEDTATSFDEASGSVTDVPTPVTTSSLADIPGPETPGNNLHDELELSQSGDDVTILQPNYDATVSEPIFDYPIDEFDETAERSTLNFLCTLEQAFGGMSFKEPEADEEPCNREMEGSFLINEVVQVVEMQKIPSNDIANIQNVLQKSADKIENAASFAENKNVNPDSEALYETVGDFFISLEVEDTAFDVEVDDIDAVPEAPVEGCNMKSESVLHCTSTDPDFAPEQLALGFFCATKPKVAIEAAVAIEDQNRAASMLDTEQTISVDPIANVEPQLYYISIDDNFPPEQPSLGFFQVPESTVVSQENVDKTKIDAITQTDTHPSTLDNSQVIMKMANVDSEGILYYMAKDTDTQPEQPTLGWFYKPSEKPTAPAIAEVEEVMQTKVTNAVHVKAQPVLCYTANDTDPLPEQPSLGFFYVPSQTETTESEFNDIKSGNVVEKSVDTDAGVIDVPEQSFDTENAFRIIVEAPSDDGMTTPIAHNAIKDDPLANDAFNMSALIEALTDFVNYDSAESECSMVVTNGLPSDEHQDISFQSVVSTNDSVSLLEFSTSDSMIAHVGCSDSDESESNVSVADVLVTTTGLHIAPDDTPQTPATNQPYIEAPSQAANISATETKEVDSAF